MFIKIKGALYNVRHVVDIDKIDYDNPEKYGITVQTTADKEYFDFANEEQRNDRMEELTNQLTRRNNGFNRT